MSKQRTRRFGKPSFKAANRDIKDEFERFCSARSIDYSARSVMQDIVRGFKNSGIKRLSLGKVFGWFDYVIKSSDRPKELLEKAKDILNKCNFSEFYLDVVVKLSYSKNPQESLQLFELILPYLNKKEVFTEFIDAVNPTQDYFNTAFYLFFNITRKFGLDRALALFLDIYDSVATHEENTKHNVFMILSYLFDNKNFVYDNNVIESVVILAQKLKTPFLMSIKSFFEKDRTPLQSLRLLSKVVSCSQQHDVRFFLENHGGESLYNVFKENPHKIYVVALRSCSQTLLNELLGFFRKS